MTEADMISKLLHHFAKGIQLVVITQGVKMLEEFMILLSKWENIDNISETETPKTIGFKEVTHYLVKIKIIPKHEYT